MKLLPPLDVHGQRCGENAASRFNVRSQVAHVLPDIHQFAEAQEQAVTHHGIPSAARVVFGLQACDALAKPLGLTARGRHIGGTDPNTHVRQQLVQRRRHPTPAPIDRAPDPRWRTAAEATTPCAAAVRRPIAWPLAFLKYRTRGGW